MREPHIIVRNIFAVTVIVWLTCFKASGASAGDIITVRLHEQAEITDRIVRVEHLADVLGGDDETAELIRQLDVSVLSDVERVKTVPRQQLMARLLVAGYSEEEVKVLGAKAVRLQVSEAPTHTTNDIEQAAAIAMAQSLGVSMDDVRVRLAAPLDLLMPEETTHGQTVSIDVLPPARSVAGRVRLTVRLLRDGELVDTSSGLFDVRIRQQVALASASLPSGTVLTADHLTFADEWSDTRPKTNDANQLLHRELRRPIVAGKEVSALDLKPLRTPQTKPLIEARDIVRIVARRGTLTVILRTAEALQAGQHGDTIRVRNLESRKVIAGRVVSANEVEVNLQ